MGVIMFSNKNALPHDGEKEEGKMSRRMRGFGMSGIIVTLFMFFAGFCSAAVYVDGWVSTLPVTEGEFTPVPNATVAFNEKYLSNVTNEFGSYSIGLDGYLIGSQYILKLEDDTIPEDFFVPSEPSIYLPAYTIPSIVNGDFYAHRVMVLTQGMVTELLNGTAVTRTEGTGILVVLTFEDYEGEQEDIFGATAVVRNMEGTAVGNVLYISPVENGELSAQQSLGVELVSAPTENTVGFIVFNLNPGVVMVSAQLTGYEFFWRPAFMYADSVTSGVSFADGIIGKEILLTETTEVSGILVDENLKPVGGAKVELCGLQNNGVVPRTTGADGSFTLTGVPPAYAFIARASKDGYKDTYRIVPIIGYEPASLQDEEGEVMVIISEAYIEQITPETQSLQDGGGILAGRINDSKGSPVKGAVVNIWDVYGDGDWNPYYMDCMNEEINEDLDSTSDSGLFVSLGGEERVFDLDAEKPLYLNFMLRDFFGAQYSDWSPHYLGFIFPDGVTVMMDMSVDEIRGLVNVDGEDDPGLIVVPGEELVDLLYLDVAVDPDSLGVMVDPGSLGAIVGWAGRIESLTINIEGTGSLVLDNFKIYRWIVDTWTDITANVEVDELNRTVKFYKTESYLCDMEYPIEKFYIAYNIPQGEEGSTYKAVFEKNCDLVVTTEIDDGITVEIQDVPVAVTGAPVEGPRVYVQADGPAIAVDPEMIDFGDVLVGGNKQETLTVYNAGNVDLYDVTVTVTGDNADEFSEEVLITSVFDLPVGESIDIDVTFTPASAGVKTAEVEIEYADMMSMENNGYASQEIMLVPLTGTGVAAIRPDIIRGDAICFIATAAYGSPFERHVQMLREFRERYLLTNTAGRAFVRWYYRHSPKYAAVIAGNEVLRAVARIALMPVYGVAFLFVKGLIPWLMLGLGVLMLTLRRKSKKYTLMLLMIGLLLGFSSSGFAADANLFKVAPGEHYTVMVPTTDTAGYRKLAVDFFYTYADRPVEIVTGGTTEDMIKEQHLVNAGITCGISECMQISLVVPYAVSQSSDIAGVSENGLGDIILSGKYRFTEPGTQGPGFAIAPYIQLPTGDEDGLLGADSTLAGGIRAIFDGYAGENLRFTFNVGYAYQEKEELVQIDIEHSLLFGAGITYILPNLTTFISGEIYGRSEKLFESEQTPVEGIISLGYRQENASFIIGGGAGLVNGYGASGWRVFTGLRLGM